MESYTIALSGIIGAGKTTLANTLGEVLRVPVYHEKVSDSPYLPLFYNDMDKYSFQLQVGLLTERYRQRMELAWSSAGGIEDRSIYEDPIFAKMLCNQGHLSRLDYKTYMTLFNIMERQMPRPSVVIHLAVSPPVAMERIRRRARGMESGIDIKYLTDLSAAYDEEIKNISTRTRVVILPYDREMTQSEIGAFAKDRIVKLLEPYVVTVI